MTEPAVKKCGCGPAGGCSVGTVLFRLKKFGGLCRHLGEPLADAWRPRWQERTFGQVCQRDRLAATVLEMRTANRARAGMGPLPFAAAPAPPRPRFIREQLRSPSVFDLRDAMLRFAR